VHTGEEAAQSASRLGARAYTIGRHVVLGRGAYRPETAGGQSLLAHELAHATQPGPVADATRVISEPGDKDEVRAEKAAVTVRWGALSSRYASVAPVTAWHGAQHISAAAPALAPSPAGALIQRLQLTYDDGPDPAGHTRAILATLNAAGARATFYLVGKRVAQSDNWRVVFDIAAAGHWLGNHAYDWNDATDNHVFLNGTAEERAEKILRTEWAIRDALIQGRNDAKQRQAWETIPQAHRDYIDDVVAHGTGRFRTPGFRSKPWDKDGTTTLAALASANQVLAATGLRPLVITELSKLGPDYEGVTVDPEDWRSGRTQTDIESGVKGNLSSNADSVLLHSRIKATADATPAIVSDIQARGWTFDPTVRGLLGSKAPKAGFAGLSVISSPPTSAEIAAARGWLRKGLRNFGPYLSGAVAIGIFQLAQQAGSAEVSAFASEIKATTIKTPDGDVPMANWMSANPEWRLFTTFFENWLTNKPFPRIKGVTI
jgi:peptidoglycan/xylan/chitin deacetylase (PgdA/CDA1 family)